MRHRLSAVVGLALLVWAAVVPHRVHPVAALTNLPEGFYEDPPIDGIFEPLALDWTPDGRLFIGSRRGSVRVFKDGALLAAPAIQLSVENTSERGLLGLVFDPQFAAQPYVYLYYTTGPQSKEYAGVPANRVSRFDVVGDDIALSSEHILVDGIPASGSGLHNGGDLSFDRDGMLFISTGDNGNSQNAQNLDSPNGKILRIDPATGLGVEDNPFYQADASAIRQRIWAYGLRNPFRFAINPVDAMIYIADVGNNNYEELDVGRAGANYGWPNVEGPLPAGVPYVDYPLFWYSHTQNADPGFDGCGSIIGGDFVTGSNFPADYLGAYFFGDFVCNSIWRVEPGSPPTITPFARDTGKLTHLAFGPDGSLFYSDWATNSVRRIRYLAGNRPPSAHATANPTAGTLPLTVQFSSAESSDPDEDALTYSWDFGDGTSSTAANPTHTFTTIGVFDVVLTVTDSKGAGARALPVKVFAGDNAPVARISSPADGARFRIGAAIVFEGSGSDVEDGVLSGADLTWEILRHHGTTHSHPWGNGSGSSLVTTMPPPEDLATIGTSFLEAILTATDSSGASVTDTVSLNFDTVDLTFETEPPGLQIVLDGETYTTPMTVASTVGWTFPVAMPDQEGCQGYVPRSWSGTLVENNVLTTPEADATITALFERVTPFCTYVPVVNR